MYIGHWGSLARSAADRVVEEEDALGAGDMLEEQGLDFRIVIRLDGSVVCEGFFG